jgi:hypothetical protein
MKRIKYIIVFLLLINSTLFTLSFAQDSTELIADNMFEWGLNVLDPSTGANQGTIIWQDIDIAPFWELGQWNSKTSAIDIEPSVSPTGAYVWEDSNKIIKMGTRDGEGYDLYLGVNSISEYDSVFRVNGQPWPHLLVQERISPPGNVGPGCPPLSQLSQLLFQVDACLDTVKIIKTGDYNPSIHAAQFLIYFTVQNLGSNSNLFGKYVWLGVQVYDDRNPSPPKYVAHDDGTRMLIYSIAYDETADSTTHSGDWVHFMVDLLPHAKAAVTEAWNRGYFSYEDGDSTVTPPLNFDDYKIGGMNMGWEAPGMFYAAFKVKDLSLTSSIATTIEDEKRKTVIESLKLYGNYPNPFNPQTSIRYEIANEEHVKIDVFSINGRLLATLVNRKQHAGLHSVNWEARDLASGIYAYRIAAGNKVKYGKMILLK